MKDASESIHMKLFTHPACSCGNTIDLVTKIVNEHPKLSMKEISLQTAEGRKEASDANVKIIPSLYFIDSEKLLVTSKEITELNIMDELKSILKNTL